MKKIAYLKLWKIRYITEGSFLLKIFSVHNIIFVFIASVCFKIARTQLNYSVLISICMLVTTYILLRIFEFINDASADNRLLKNIAKQLMNDPNLLTVYRFLLENKKGDRISIITLRNPLYLFLLGKILESSFLVKQGKTNTQVAQQMMLLAIQHDPSLSVYLTEPVASFLHAKRQFFG